VWRPLLIALALAAVMGLAEQIVDGLSHHGLFAVMSGERYFRGHGVPWLGLIAVAALSAAMLYGATVNLARRDF